MTKKDYILFAKVLNKFRKSKDIEREDRLVYDIAHIFLKENKSFNWREFIDSVE